MMRLRGYWCSEVSRCFNICERVFDQERDVCISMGLLPEEALCIRGGSPVYWGGNRRKLIPPNGNLRCYPRRQTISRGALAKSDWIYNVCVLVVINTRRMSGGKGFSLYFWVILYNWGKDPKQELKQKARRSTAYSSWLTQSTFSYNSRPPAHGDPAHSELGPCTSIVNPENVFGVWVPVIL